MCMLAHAVGPDQGLVQPEACKYGDSEQAAVYQLRVELTELQAQAAEWRSEQQERAAQHKSIKHLAEKTKILQIQMEEVRQERAGESIIMHAEKGGSDPPPQVDAPAQMAPIEPPLPKEILENQLARALRHDEKVRQSGLDFELWAPAVQAKLDFWYPPLVAASEPNPPPAEQPLPYNVKLYSGGTGRD